MGRDVGLPRATETSELCSGEDMMEKSVLMDVYL